MKNHITLLLWLATLQNGHRNSLLGAAHPAPTPSDQGEIHIDSTYPVQLNGAGFPTRHTMSSKEAELPKQENPTKV